MRSKSSRKRNGKRINRSAVWLLLAAASAFLFCGVFLSFRSTSLSSDNTGRLWVDENAQLETTSPSSNDTYLPKGDREVYPYSVVPGGVRTPEELREASTKDHVVGDHYSGFDFRKARVVKVRQPRLVYLSYRIGNEIYWTAKKVSLHTGENLITDGKVTARTRCGNQVSALPQKKTSSQEPALAQFDGPIGSSTRAPFPDNFHSALESRPGPGWVAPALGPAGAFPLISGGSSPLGGGYLPIGSPLVPGSGCNNHGSSGNCGTTPGPVPTPAPGTPSVPVPEPRTPELFLGEILGMITFWTIFSRKKTV